MSNEYIGVYWSMSINGVELDDEKRCCVKSVTLETPCDGSNTLTFELQDPGFLFIDDNIFIEEATVDYSMNIVGETSKVSFHGYISTIDITFPEDGVPVLSIYCLDSTHRMTRETKSRSWDNVTRPEVVQKIAREYGFKCVVESGYSFTREDTISQSDQTDIEFCESLASEEREQFMCKLRGDTLYYVKKGVLSSPSQHLYYREFPFNVRSFSPKINKETQQVECTVSNINTDTKVTETSVSTRSNTPRDTQGESVIPSASPTPSSSSSGPVMSNKDSSSGGGQKYLKYDPVTGTWK